MIQTSEQYNQLINAPARRISARAELWSSASPLAFSSGDNLISFTIERQGEQNKFFGFGVCQKLKLELADKERVIEIKKGDTFNIVATLGGEDISAYPLFYVDEVKRNENNNNLSIVAYDSIYDAVRFTIDDIDLPSYTIEELMEECAHLIHADDVAIVGVADDYFSTYYEAGANFDGSETLREVLNAIAEATQTIYYINCNNTLTFKKLDKDGDAVLVLGKSDYFTLQNKGVITLGNIAHTTELGNNLMPEVELIDGAVIQYVRNNPFWDMYDERDLAQWLEDAVRSTRGLAITQFDCSWRGNFALEIGDRLEIETKDGETFFTYVLNDTISYNGGLKEQTTWSYEANAAETATNPTSLGEVLKNTFAKVDKINQEITLVANTANVNSSELATLKINTDSISQTVQAQETKLGDVSGEIETLTEQVNLAITQEQLTIEVSAQLENGVSKVRTGKNFTFDDSGLTIEDINEDTNKVITTTVSNNGMVVAVDRNDVLTANDEGVIAVDLHAKTFLKIGKNSRLEDMGNRTACFWTGG